MLFDSRYQHSVVQLNKLNALFKQGETSATESLFLATEATQHGHPKALSLIDILLKKIKKKEVQDYLSSLKLQSQFINSIPAWGTVKANQEVLKKLYELNGYNFMKGSTYPSKLIIVFTTMFNNFYMSNPVFVAFLSQFGVSILILKDATRYNYLNGVKGLGGNLSEVAERIKLIIDKERIEDILITGFSSGGYSSLVFSCLVPCNRYLGFSVRSDFSDHSSLQSAKFFTNEVREKVDKRWLVNVKDMLTVNQMQWRKDIYVGQNTPVDMEHAENLRQINNVYIHELSCGHITLAPLMESGELIRIFHDFIFESK
jgi:hypothetical protein